MIRRAAALVAVTALLSCDPASLRPLELLADGAEPGALDWRTPEGDTPLALLDRLGGVRRDPLQRALLQRDLWMTFDLGSAARERIARLMLDLALTSEDIARLPDTYAESAKRFPPLFDPSKPDQPFLPPDLLDPDGPWVVLAFDTHPAAMNHNRFFRWRSGFLILVRHPDGRDATRRFVDGLKKDRYPAIPDGMEFANVRRALLISDRAVPTPSPITESVQLRHYYGKGQAMFKFELHRSDARLRPLAKDEVRPPYAVSFEHVAGKESRSVPVMATCANCHPPGGAVGILSFIPMSSGMSMTAGDAGRQMASVARRKAEDDSFEALRKLWAR